MDICLILGFSWRICPIQFAYSQFEYSLNSQLIIKIVLNVAVVGAGISGLVCAWQLCRSGVDVVVLEAASVAGGKMRFSTIGDTAVDAGPDGFLVRDSAVVDLCRQVGLSKELVSPATKGAFVWCQGALRPLPKKSILGVPYDVDAVAKCGILSPHGLDRLKHGVNRRITNHPMASVADDAASFTDGTASVAGGTLANEVLKNDAAHLGSLLRPYVGDETFERLIDPLLGGIHAGPADEMSLAVCAPRLHSAMLRGGVFRSALKSEAESLNVNTQKSVSSQKSDSGVDFQKSVKGDSGAVFGSLHGGVTRLADVLTAQLQDRVHLNTPVLALTRKKANSQKGIDSVNTSSEWVVRTNRGTVCVDAVILACPAPVAAELLQPHSHSASTILSEVQYCDVGIVTFCFPAQRVVHTLEGSGFVVPRSEGKLTTACSWTSSKWRHYRTADKVVMRVSVGRLDDRRWLHLSKDELMNVLIKELIQFGLLDDSVRYTPNDYSISKEHNPHRHTPERQMSERHRTSQQRHTGSISVSAAVTAWHGALPQYRPGHLQRVDEVERQLELETPGVKIAGAALRGLGLPACVRQAQMTTAKLLQQSSFSEAS